jgi:hypothetical protein
MFITCSHRNLHFTDVKKYMDCPLCVGEIYFITHPIFNFVFPLLHAWVSIVSINLCNPCDQGRVDIIIKNMYFHVGNKLIEFISSLFCIHLYMFATRAKSTNKCGFWTCMFSLNCLLAWYIKPVDCGRVRHGKTEVSLTNSASCSMHHDLSWKVSYPIWCTLTFPLSVLGRVPIGLICYINGNVCRDYWKYHVNLCKG